MSAPVKSPGLRADQYYRFMLLGRGNENAALDDLLARAGAGEGGAVVVRGEPGIGKSALLASLVGRRGNAQLLRTQGVESESPLAFGALHRMLLPMLDRVAMLPEPQRRALDRAFGSSSDENEGDRFLVFLAGLSLVSEAAEDRVVLCVIDDAHWLDDASLAALLFIARRIEFAPVAMVFAARDGEARDIYAPDLPELILNGLPEEAAEELILQGRQLAAEVRRDLIGRTGGNPLALVEIPATLSEDEASGVTPLPPHLPLTDNLERVFAARAHVLSADAQQFLLLAAIDDSGDPVVVRTAADRLGLAEGVIDEVSRSGLVEVLDREVRLRHPLVRSAVFAEATTTKRRRSHGALAVAFEEHHDPDRAVWHLAAASDTPDEGIATRLEDAGHRLRQRGAHEAASSAFERAAQLSRSRQAVGVRLSSAAQAAWLAGNPARTRRLAQRARAATSDSATLADLDRLRAFVEMNFGSPRLAHGILAGAATKAGDSGDKARARQLSMVATALAAFGADSGAPVAIENLSDPESADLVEASFSALLVGLDHIGHGRIDRGVPFLRRALELGEVADAPDLMTNLGIATLLIGDDDLALRWHNRQLDAARDQASVLGVLHALTRRAIAQLAIGRWHDLTAANEEVLDLARATGHTNQRALPLAQLLVIDAYRGSDDIPARADDIEQLTRVNPSGVLEDLALDTARWARGVHAARTAPDVALHHFEAIKMPLMWRAAAMDIAEAAAHSGNMAAAKNVAAELGQFAIATGNAWAAAAADHAAALVAPEPEREALFLSALAHHRDTARQFSQARTELAYGEHLRRARRRVDARGHLRAAVTVFEEVDADPWAQRGGEELRASGEASRRRTPSTADPTTTLTAQELQVARLVQEGLSNKDVAARLFLSPRTIEFHLRNIFGKLGITSRIGLSKVQLPRND